MKFPVIVNEGEIVTCPNPECRTEIARVIRDITQGDALHESFFRSFGAAIIVNGASPICPECSAPYFYNGRLHTKSRWKPEVP